MAIQCGKDFLTSYKTNSFSRTVSSTELKKFCRQSWKTLGMNAKEEQGWKN